jgi:hypothetical protein
MFLDVALLIPISCFFLFKIIEFIIILLLQKLGNDSSGGCSLCIVTPDRVIIFTSRFLREAFSSKSKAQGQ